MWLTVPMLALGSTWGEAGLWDALSTGCPASPLPKVLPESVIVSCVRPSPFPKRL